VLPATMADAPASAGRCAWLVLEGLRTEERAANLDRSGQSAQAALHHARAASKFKEAAESCPADHEADRNELEGHSADIAARAVYLESLGGMPPTMPLEDHIGELQIGLDLSAAEEPKDEKVAELLARSGVTGDSADLSDEGLQMVLALQSEVELRSFLLRILGKDWRQVKADDASQQELVSFAKGVSGGASAASFSSLREQLRSFPWVELKLGPGEDRLKVAVAMENEAREFESKGQLEEALDGYNRAVAVLKLVYNFDPRSKNPKIKEMVATRIAELEGCARRLDPGQPGPPTSSADDDDLEARLRKLRE